MKLTSYIITLTIIALLSGCSSFNRSKTQEIVFLDDGNSTSKELLHNNEVVIDDKMLSDTRKKADKETEPTISTDFPDGSSLSVGYDSAGNKTESKCFNNHIKIGCIVLKTPVVGEKSINVLAQNGKVEILSANVFPDVMTVSPDEIAVAAGITEGRRTNQPQLTFKTKPEIRTNPIPTTAYYPPVIQQNEEIVTQPEKEEQISEGESKPPINGEENN